MSDTLEKLDPRTIEDMRIRYRAAMLESHQEMMRHGDYFEMYLTDGDDRFASFHLGQMKSCMKRTIATHNDLVALDQRIGGVKC